ncbi:MAG: hypothetical protein ACKVX7_00805 [Planctomycetota bacterium]
MRRIALLLLSIAGLMTVGLFTREAAAQLAYPSGVEDFESLVVGDSVVSIGWIVVSTSPMPSDFAVIGATPGFASATAVRVVDVDSGDVQNRFYSPGLQAPVESNYSWSWYVNFETPPPGGTAVKPRLTIQHFGVGFVNSWGVEFADDGMRLVVTGNGGPAGSVLLNGPPVLGTWHLVELSVDFDADTVTAAIDGGVPASLPIALTGDPTLFRFCYRGEGVGNVATFLVDRVSVVIDEAPNFVRGDCNNDGGNDIADAVFGLSFLFSAGAAPDCSDACDGNDDGSLDVGDMISILSALFGGGPPLPAPNSCGPDLTSDSLTCDAFSGC